MVCEALIVDPQKDVNAKDAKDSAKERNASLGLLDHIMILQLREGMIYKADLAARCSS